MSLVKVTARFMSLLEQADLETLVALASAAIIAAERKHGRFCRDCGTRAGLHHLANCTYYERGDATVQTFDCLDVEDLVGRAVEALRGHQ